MIGPSPDLPETTAAADPPAERRSGLTLVLFALLMFVLWWTGTLSQMVRPEVLRRLVTDAGPAAPLMFIAVLVPLNPFFLAGAPVWISSTLFPLHLAMVYSIAGVVIASAGTHAAARYLGRDWARGRIPKRIHRFGERLERNPLRGVATLRMLLWINPGVDLLTAVSQIRMRDYLLGTLLGIALPTVLRVYIGQKGIEAASGSPAWFWVTVALVAIAAVAVHRYRQANRPASLSSGG